MPLQEELDNGKQQLNNAEQDSKAALAAQLSQHEVALRSTQQNSEQKLQQALREVEVSCFQPSTAPSETHTHVLVSRSAFTFCNQQCTVNWQSECRA